jgi:hypothetical protein
VPPPGPDGTVLGGVTLVLVVGVVEVPVVGVVCVVLVVGVVLVVVDGPVVVGDCASGWP